jgi:hypothetical protein
LLVTPQALLGLCVLVKARQDRPVKKTITEQIASFEATLAAKVEERDAIMNKSADEGVTLDAEQTEAYDALDTEIQNLNAHIARLKKLETENVKAAKEVTGKTKEEGPPRATSPASVVKDTMPNDIAFGAMVLCKAHSYLELQKGNLITPMQVAKNRYPGNARHPGVLRCRRPPWPVARPPTRTSRPRCLAPAAVLESAFLEYLRPKTLIDRFGTNQNGVQIPSC